MRLAHPLAPLSSLEREERVRVGVRRVDDDAVDRLLLVLTRLAVGDEGVRLLHRELPLYLIPLTLGLPLLAGCISQRALGTRASVLSDSSPRRYC